MLLSDINSAFLRISLTKIMSVADPHLIYPKNQPLIDQILAQYDSCIRLQTVE